MVSLFALTFALALPMCAFTAANSGAVSVSVAGPLGSFRFVEMFSTFLSRARRRVATSFSKASRSRYDDSTISAAL